MVLLGKAIEPLGGRGVAGGRSWGFLAQLHFLFVLWYPMTFWCNTASPTVHALPNMLESVPLQLAPINPVFKPLVRCMATAMKRPAQKMSLHCFEHLPILSIPRSSPLGNFRIQIWPASFSLANVVLQIWGLFLPWREFPMGPLSRSRGPGPACVLRQLLLLQSRYRPSAFQATLVVPLPRPGAGSVPGSSALPAAVWLMTLQSTLAVRSCPGYSRLNHRIKYAWGYNVSLRGKP